MCSAKILRVDKTGFPMECVTPKEACSLIINERVLWHHGEENIILFGGVNSLGRQSSLEIPAIIATDGRDKSAEETPPLTRRGVYERDSYQCQICGAKPGYRKLSLDHVIPKSRGGSLWSWCNLICACKSCNHFKGNKLLHEANLQLIAIPFVPSRHEHIYLMNRNTLNPDQVEYLKSGIRDSLLAA